MAWKEGQFDVAEPMVNKHLKAFSINLNVRYVNGMTKIKLAKICHKTTCFACKEGQFDVVEQIQGF